MIRPKLDDDQYQRLLALRTGLRRFLHWSEQRAHEAGLTPAHHQLLLAIRGHLDPRGPTITDIADYLLLRHHSAVGLVQRAEALGLVEREHDDDDRRVVRLSLSDRGHDALEELSALHVEELDRMGFDLRPLWRGIEGSGVPAEDSEDPVGEAPSDTARGRGRRRTKGPPAS